MTVRPPQPARIGTTRPQPEPISDGDELIISGVQLQAADLSEIDSDFAEVNGSRLDDVRLAGSRWRHAVVADTLLTGCDLANTEFSESGWQRIEVVRSRLTGLRAAGCSWKNLTITDSMINLANLRMLDGQRLRFVGCNLTGADFGSAQLTDVEFIDCDLTEADFNNVRNLRVRFQRCRLIRIAGVAGLAGARIDRADLLDLADSLADALGITVDPGDSDAG
jgi:uncharacterized protein YjbI with pentapeptide repeats